jgi:hypothetical protein
VGINEKFDHSPRISAGVLFFITLHDSKIFNFSLDFDEKNHDILWVKVPQNPSKNPRRGYGGPFGIEIVDAILYRKL